MSNCNNQNLFGADPAEASNEQPENSLTQSERDKLVLGVQKLCWKLAREYHERLGSDSLKCRYPVDDLASQAMLASVESARTFDPAMGAAFTTYASSWIRSRLLTYTDERKLPSANSNADSLESWPVLDGCDGDDAEVIPEIDERTAILLRSIEREYGSDNAAIVRAMVVDGIAIQRVAEQFDTTERAIRLLVRSIGPRLKRMVAALDMPTMFDACEGE